MPRISTLNLGHADTDAVGYGCPIGAHIRRANPRDSLFDDPELYAYRKATQNHEAWARSYGGRTDDVYQNDGRSRGLHFICLNSNIERQFEFIQRTWVNNEKFGALDHETDPLVGHRKVHNLFSMSVCPARTRIHHLDNFVTTKGGAYFFIPGVKALKELSLPFKPK